MEARSSSRPGSRTCCGYSGLRQTPRLVQRTSAWAALGPFFCLFCLVTSTLGPLEHRQQRHLLLALHRARVYPVGSRVVVPSLGSRWAVLQNSSLRDYRRGWRAHRASSASSGFDPTIFSAQFVPVVIVAIDLETGVGWLMVKQQHPIAFHGFVQKPVLGHHRGVGLNIVSE